MGANYIGALLIEKPWRNAGMICQMRCVLKQLIMNGEKRMRRPPEPNVPLKFGEYFVWDDRASKYEVWGSTRVFDGEKFIKMRGV